MTEKTILVIDTDAETSRKVESILESEGYTVHNSAGRNDSISAAVKIKPSLIFINIAMRDTSGLEIAKGIHETESLKDVPIIIITPHGGTIEPRYTAMYGIVDFVAYDKVIIATGSGFKRNSERFFGHFVVLVVSNAFCA